jgi:hypothetical protein
MAINEFKYQQIVKFLNECDTDGERKTVLNMLFHDPSYLSEDISLATRNLGMTMEGELNEGTRLLLG